MLKVFENSCFGKYVSYKPDYVFNVALFHAIMAREIRVKGASEYELWFGICRCKARFSKREFCLVTGLKCGCLSNIFNEEYEAVDGGIHDIYFNKNSDLHVKSLHEAFLTVEFKDKKDTLKMTLVLFVEQILMGQDYRHKVSL
ncbi:hypothetical protein CRYUN_Cryun16bG0059200 [Craigia yunnanensis]